MTQAARLAIPPGYPRHMRHAHLYRVNNCPRHLTGAVARYQRAGEHVYVDQDAHAFRWGHDGVHGALQEAHQAGDGVLLIIHWLTAERNGFRWIERREGGGRRRLSHGELHANLGRWPAEKVLRLRSAERGGCRPMTVYESLDICAAHGQVCNVESKGGSPTARVEPWARAARYGHRIGARFAMKTLPTGNWLARCAAAWRGGWSTAVIGGGRANYPGRPRRWPRYVTAVWGPSRWRPAFRS